jgi:hypothetical protein
MHNTEKLNGLLSHITVKEPGKLQNSLKKHKNSIPDTKHDTKHSKEPSQTDKYEKNGI